jgi:rSAM/selenodomain-associated transferase 2
VKLAVVIPTFDEHGRIVPSVQSAQVPGVEVLVVDGGSRDGTAELARGLGVRVLDAPKGRARQLSAGVRAAAGSVLLFLHADSILPEGWPSAVRDALADPEVAGGFFDLHFDERSMALRFVEWGVRLRVALFALPYGDQALFVRREVLEATGGIPMAPLMEDLDLVRAIKTKGKLARVQLPVVTSARRYRAGGVLPTMWRHWLALIAWRLGIDRRRVARWYAR